jgi:apolipoprotein N-acyltransferase
VTVPARRGRTALPALVAGVLLSLSLPPWGWWPLGLVGAAVLYWRLAGQRARTRLWAGWLAGLGCYGPGLMWARTFNWYGALLLIALEALFFASAALLTPPRRGRAPAFVAAGTLAEAVRMTWPFGGLPLGGVFLGQADGPLLALARLGGPLLLTAGVWAGGAGLASLVSGLAGLRSGRRADSWTRSWTGTPSDAVVALRGAAILVVLGLAIVLGALAPDGGPVVRSVTVAAVQGGGRRGVDKEQVAPATVYAAQVRATRPLLSEKPSPSLVLWPEDVIALGGPLRGSVQGAAMAAEARHLHTTLVAGVTEPASPTTFYNTIVAWGPDGRIVGTFEKVHRVPFGEYVPYRSFVAHFANLSEVPADAVPGHGTGLLRTPAGPLGTLVSFEVFYANRSRTSVRAGAELLIVPTNTSSYATAQVPTQEVAADAVQAVETGRDVVQAAPTGYSSVVDQRGRVLNRSALGRQQVLTATVPLRRGYTPYDHLGDLPFLVLAGLGLLAAWALQRRAARYP